MKRYLKPCPKCGGQGVFVERDVSQTGFATYFTVVCNKCGYDCNPDNRFWNIQTAIRAWNQDWNMQLPI